MTDTSNQKWPQIAGEIRGDHHVLPVRIYYEDTDFSGFVYHANYVKYCERGRSDCLRLVGVHHHELNTQDTAQGVGGQAGFVVRKMNCEFLRPAMIDYLLEVKTWFVLAKGARMELQQSIWHGQTCLFKADVTAALVDGTGRPKRLSPEMIAAFSTLHAS